MNARLAFVSYAFSHYGMTFTPHFDASGQHEFLHQSRGITSPFGGFGGGSLHIRTIHPSRDSALVDAGFDIDVNRTVTVSPTTKSRPVRTITSANRSRAA